MYLIVYLVISIKGLMYVMNIFSKGSYVMNIKGLYCVSYCVSGNFNKGSYVCNEYFQ